MKGCMHSSTYREEHYAPGNRLIVGIICADCGDELSATESGPVYV